MDYAEKLDEHDVKIETLLLFQGTDLHQDQLEDLVGIYDNEALSKILEDDLGDMDDTEVYEYFNNNFLGYFIAEVHTPVKKPFGRRKTLSWSWGTTTLTLVIAKTFEELIEKSCAWADAKEEEFRKGFEEEEEIAEESEDDWTFTEEEFLERAKVLDEMTKKERAQQRRNYLAQVVAGTEAGPMANFLNRTEKGRNLLKLMLEKADKELQDGEDTAK